jgi:hypothetical protein
MSREEFFDAVVECARLSAASGQNDAVDPITLRGYGLDDEGLRRFLDAMKPVVQMPEHRQFLEHAFLSAFQELFTMIDGLTAIADKAVDVVDLDGNVLSEDLHMEFGNYLFRKHIWRS